MTTTEAPEFTRTCAWSGEDTPGKHYVLTTTEGQEIVSEEAFRALPKEAAEQLSQLAGQVERLTHRVKQLSGGNATAEAAPRPRPRKRAASVPAQAGSAED